MVDFSAGRTYRGLEAGLVYRAAGAITRGAVLIIATSDLVFCELAAKKRRAARG